MHQNWFMFSPYSTWMVSIVSFVLWHAKHGRNYSEIIRIVQKYGPKNGWDSETKQFVKLAAKLAVSKTDE